MLWIVYNIIPCIFLHLSKTFVIDNFANYKHGELIVTTRGGKRVMQYRNRREESTLVTTMYRDFFCRFRIEANHT